MAAPDLNLLVALEVLLDERSVTGAARRLGLSASATSRILARLRRATGDQLLVPAGRGLVRTRHGEALQARMAGTLRDAQALLAPATQGLDLASLDRAFAIRANEIFVELASAALIAAVTQAAPHVRLHFVPKPDKDAQPLRDGRIDLEIGVLGTAAPELRTRLLFRDRFVGICRAGHPLLAGEGPTAERYAACRHVATSRRGEPEGPVDEALAALGLSRRLVATVPTYSNAIQVARNSDLVAITTEGSLGNALVGDRRAALGIARFALPVETADLAISAIWHPRFEGDPAHGWLRDTVASVCRAAYR